MLSFLYALIPVIAWGTWLTPSQNVVFRNQQIKTFYVAAANLALASAVILFQGSVAWTLATFWLPFAGGLIWAVSGLCAFTATNRLGMARAFGIWAPLNIITSLFWGAFLFDEFLNTSPQGLVLLIVSVLVIIAGVLMIIFAKGAGSGQVEGAAARMGYLGAVGAGVLWGSYFIPLQYAGVSMWIAAFPLALGIFAGSLVLALLPRQGLAAGRPGDYARVLLTGLLWGLGNYGMLLLVDSLGAGKGFTITQLSVVVNALCGIYLLKDPAPRSRAAALTLVGCVLAMLGGIVLGNLK